MVRVAKKDGKKKADQSNCQKNKMHMKTTKTILFLLAMLMSTVVRMNAREIMKTATGHTKSNPNERIMSGCTAGVTQDQLQINNVRTTILTSGDMWWNLVSAKYEVPKGGGASSIFAGSLWIGGLDAGGQLKIAAMTYRQNGIDFFPGPMDTATVSSSTNECLEYDKHWPMTYLEVSNFVNGIGPYTARMAAWPGNGDPTYNEGKLLAPFFDKNGNGVYDKGVDYPLYSMGAKKLSCSVPQLFGDYTMWGVFNDEGNIHTETNGNPIGLEVRYQCFAYTTTDDINNATFYDYQVINRSSFTVNRCYFGVWVDFDLGWYDDDFTGCNVQGNLGYGYNGTPIDGTGGPGTYGANPPAVGVDFFRGPKVDPANPTDGIDQSGVSFVNPVTHRIGMAKFVYYNNDFSEQGNPTTAQAYYNYLSGFWIDGTPFTYGGNAYKGSGPVCDFMFPGDTDPLGTGTKNVPQPAWAEYPTPANPAGDAPGDRRFMESAGPFTLTPGAVNSVTTGVVWARTTQGGNLASLPLLFNANVLAQALFNNCFAITNGPDAPDMTVQELSNELIIYLTNKSTSNNYKESYAERDPYITINLKDSLYHFQGYQIYQITDSSVTIADVTNADRARLIFQCDIKDGVKQIINYYKNANLGGAWVPQQMVLGADSGISHSFTVTSDAFSTTTNSSLVNQKQYFFIGVAYGYNVGETNSNPNNPPDGYNLPYINSRRNVHYVIGIPHIPTPQNGGTTMNSTYGLGVQLTRLEGQGNGGNVMNLIPASIQAILNAGVYAAPVSAVSYGGNPAVNYNGGSAAGGRVVNVTYDRSVGPINIQVIDPLSIPAANFQISVSDSSGKARWLLTNTGTGAIIRSDTTIAIGNQQIIPSLGISIKVQHSFDVCSSKTGFAVNAPLFSTMTFTDPTQQWLTGVPELVGATSAASGGDENWIRSGTNNPTPATAWDSYANYDPSGWFQKIVGGTWAPYRMCAYSDAAQTCTGGPALSFNSFNLQYMNKTLASVDVVFTSNKANWTRCPVLELQEDSLFAEGHARKLSYRNTASVDKNGVKGDGVTVSNDPNSAGYVAARGMGWFPGYAINIETGERLNMAFGEDSGLPFDNGRDMLWNPDANMWDFPNPIFGGKHYIYVFAHVADQTQAANDAYLPKGPKNIPRYDAGLALWQLLDAEKRDKFLGNYSKYIWGDAMWVNIPLLAAGHKIGPPTSAQIFETDAKVSIRVGRNFRKAFSAFFGKTSVSDPVLIDTVALPAKPQNRNWPLYSFTTIGLQVQTNQNAVAKNALDLINVVPNPYYAYSGYETSQTDNRVKITNLPEACTIRIFTISGLLVKVIHKDDPTTYSDWTLTNQANIPIASGLYLIDVKVPGIGEKVLKWFGVIRPIDLDSY
jgi:hypothetical protein